MDQTNDGTVAETTELGQPPAEDESCTVRLRGLPFRATEFEIEKFLTDGGVKIKASTVVIQQGADGRPSGQAFVEVETEEDMQTALGLSGQSMGHRYIEIYRASGSSHAAANAPMNTPRLNYPSHSTEITDLLIRLRGLPFQATEQDVANFLNGVGIAQHGIHLEYNHENRPSGEAYVELQSQQDVQMALMRNKKRLGHRYIEVFPSTYDEMNGKRGRGGRGAPYGKGGGRDDFGHDLMNCIGEVQTSRRT